MILTRKPTHALRALLVLTCTLSTALATFGAQPTTRPAAKQIKTAGDPASKLAAAVPAGWLVRGSKRVGRSLLHPGRQWSRVSTGYVELRSTLIRTKEGLQRTAPPVIVWLAHSPAERAKWEIGENHWDIEKKPTEYLGKGSGYYVYVHLPPAAAGIWLNAKQDISHALGIKAPTTQPAGPNGQRAVVRMTQKGDTVSYSLDGVECGDIKALAKALAEVPRVSPLVIQIETNVSSKHVAEVVTIARKLRLTKISITVVRTSAPPAKPKWKPPL